MNPDTHRYEGDADQMQASDGLAFWEDGASLASTTKSDVPAVSRDSPDSRLWVITDEDVLHAPEFCPFGAERGARRLKHSNLTAGGDAYVGGELVFLGDQSIVISACSGRYRVRNAQELAAVASAFRGSGYRVWSMGYNTDTNRPVIIGTQDPEWVAA
ncbi:hypothetical protein [Caulobacter sp. S45]|uniref:hypothetical protein n=1 Tax=Caulobacter sp. S45 TaxID=1641861 RepID=UPI00157520E5|nr:hypothetical protein [Caulobacter sp. S45]